MRPTAPKSTGAVRLPEAQLRTIVKSVLASPFLAGYMKGWGADPAEIERTTMKKLARFVLRKDVKSAAANIRALEKRLAKANPIEAVEIRRKLEFAKLEGSSK